MHRSQEVNWSWLDDLVVPRAIKLGEVHRDYEIAWKVSRGVITKGE